jgi:hypothetical protein
MSTIFADEYLTAAELGLEELNPYMYCNITEHLDETGQPDGKLSAVLTVQEDFRFHRDLDREKGNPHNQLFNLDGRPTEAVLTVLRNLVDERYHGEEFDLDEDGTEWFQFDIVLTVDPETTAEDLGVKFWEYTELVRFHNEADPGTFNSPYLFGSLVYDGLRELDA